MITGLLVCVAGGLGAVARFVLDGVVSSRTRARYPVGTTAINLSGSLLLGVVLGLALGQVISERWQIVLGAGFLGGYTTFSTASVDTVRLLQAHRWGAAVANAFGMLLASLLLAAAGLWVGLWL